MNTFGFFRRRRTWRRILLAMLVAVTGSLVGMIANFVKVQSIECREVPSNPAVFPICSPEIIAELERFIGQRILLLRLNNLERKIMQSDPAVKSIHLTVGIRGRTLLASVVRRIPVVRIVASSVSDPSLVIDDEGVVFESKTEGYALPVIIWDGFSTLSVGQRVPEQLGRAVTLIRQLSAVTEVLGAVHIRAGSLEVSTIEGTLVTFSLEQDPATQLAALQLVINQSRMERVIYRTVDLRFEHPIVTK